MKQDAGSRLVGWLVAIAMVLVGALAPSSPVFAHPAVQHSAALDDHGHSHDFDNVEYEPSGAHKHAHTGDHTHDVPSLPPVVNAGITGAMPERTLILRQKVPDNLPSELDRPPKSVLA